MAKKNMDTSKLVDDMFQNSGSFRDRTIVREEQVDSFDGFVHSRAVFTKAIEAQNEMEISFEDKKLFDSLQKFVTADRKDTRDTKSKDFKPSNF